MKKTYDITSIKDLDELISCFVKTLSDREVIWLEGPLGIGKSEWVRLTLKHMGYHHPVPSPSFAIHHVYSIQQKKVTHIDLYRVQKEEDLESIGFFDLFLEKRNIIFIEWADRVNIKLHNWNQTMLHFYWDHHRRMVTITSRQCKNNQQSTFESI